MASILFGGLTANAGADPLRVIDGDTIERSGVRIRLHGIDAPEAGQKCNGQMASRGTAVRRR